MSEEGTTTYKVEADFTAKDHSSEVMKHIEEQAERTAEAVESMKEGLKMAAEVIGLRELISKAGETFIGFNSAVEQTKIKLTTMIGSNFHASWKRATDVAGEMYEKFEQFADIAPVSAQEMAAFGQSVSASVLAAGGNIKDLTKIAEEGSVAAKALGFDAQRGAMEISRMMTGMVSNRSPMAKMLLGSMGLTPQQWQKLTQPQRLQKIEGGLGSDTMKDATSSLRESFGGAVSMFKDKIEVAMGKVGLPLFKAVTAEVRSWNEWIEKNPEKIAEITGKLTSGIQEAMSMMRDVGGFLMPMIKEAMSVVQDVMSFVSQHRDMLVGVAKGLLIYKGISMTGTVAGAAEHGLGDIGKIFKDLGGHFKELKEAMGGGEAGGVGGMFKSLGSAIGPLIGAGGQFALHGTALYGLSKIMFGETHDEKEKRERSAQMQLTAEEWLKDKKERDALIAAKQGYHLTNESTYQGINKRLGELHGNREDLIRAGINSGLVRESVEGNTRRLEFTGGGGANISMEALKPLVGALRDAFKEASVEAANISEAQLSMQGGHYGARFTDRGDVDFRGYMEEHIDNEVKEQQEELKSKVPVNQTVNISINQVAAKDPDRWLADMDDMVGRLGNRPRRAKSSIAAKLGPGH